MLVTGLALPAAAAEPIVGNWKTASGETAAIAACGDAYCITVRTGKHAGREIGRFTGGGADYAGEITDPVTDKTYSGTGLISNDTLKLRGCVLKVLCRSQIWTRL
jgi:uncharacterized protein (DUF2147 family)